MKSKDSEFSVALISDTGRNNLVLESVLDDVRAAGKPYSFILYLGDFVMDMDRTNFYWMLWEIRPKIRRMPMYFIPGNHDVDCICGRCDRIGIPARGEKTVTIEIPRKKSGDFLSLFY